MSGLRIMLAGQQKLAVDVLEDLQTAGHNVLRVSSPVHTRSGGQDRLMLAAEAHGIPWQPAGHLRDPTSHDARKLASLDLDLIVCAHAHEIVGRLPRLLTRHGALGYHPSLLPRWRGRYAVEWTCISGDIVAGGSAYWLTDDCAAGPLQLRAQLPLSVQGPWTSPRDLWREHLQPLGRRMIAHAVYDITQGHIRRTPQEGTPTYAVRPYMPPSALLDSEGGLTADQPGGW